MPTINKSLVRLAVAIRAELDAHSSRRRLIELPIKRLGPLRIARASDSPRRAARLAFGRRRTFDGSALRTSFGRIATGGHRQRPASSDSN